MARTMLRPIPTGHLTTSRRSAMPPCICVASMSMLWMLVNPLTAVLTFASLIGYAVLYTVWLKHITPQNIVIGGAAGAAPPVLGWTAVTGPRRPACAAAVPDHLRVDSAALLGARDRATRGVREGRHPDAAGDLRRRVHATAHPALHDPALHRDPASVAHRHDRSLLSRRRRGPGRCSCTTRSRSGARARRRTCR